MHLFLLLHALCVAAPPPGSTPDRVHRFALVIGANKGSADEPGLQFATSDAREVARVLNRVGGFQAEDMEVVLNPDIEHVRTAFTHIRRMIAQTPDRESMLMVYYSGHADALNIHLGGTLMSWNEFLRLTNSSRADTRLLIADACRSGELTHVKGAALEVPFALPEQGPALPRGIAIVTSASAGENAQESPSLGGSFFTHHFLAALQGAGDLNGDGRVTLNEAFDYSASQTVSDTAKTLAGVQHATFRYRLAGRLELPLSSPGYARSLGALHIDAPGAYILHHDTSEGPLALEMSLPAHANRTVWLPAGRYYVQRRTPSGVYAGYVSVTQHEEVAMRDANLARADYLALAEKGKSSGFAAAPEEGGAHSAYDVRPRIEPVLLFSGGGAALSGMSPALGGTVGVGVPLDDRFTLDFMLQYLHTGTHGSALQISQSDLALLTGFRVRVVRAGPFTLSLGPRIGVQTSIQQYSGANLSTRQQWEPVADGVLRADIRLNNTFFILGEGAIRVAPNDLTNSAGQTSRSITWQPIFSVGVGARF